jgi:hypothetical protein
MNVLKVIGTVAAIWFAASILVAIGWARFFGGRS